MTAFRIGVNALYLIPGGVGGTEVYLRSLLAAMAGIDRENEYVIFTNRETGSAVVLSSDRFRCAIQPVNAVNRPARILWEQFRLPAVLRRERIDVLLNPGFTSPVRSPCPVATVFHDLQHKRHPQHFRWFDLPFWNLLLWQAARTSQALIAVSQATATDMERFYPGSALKTTVVHHGVDERFFEIGRRRRDLLPEPFLLCVSTLHPHKNLERLVRAFRDFRRSRPEFRLVLAGMHGFHTGLIARLLQELDLAEAVELPGWLSREQLYDFFLRAHTCVFPSTFEGFGMPVLEALAAGVPTACSAIAPHAEVAGEAARFFDPSDDAALLEAMIAVAGEPQLRKQLALAGPERAALFSWEKTAQETLAVLKAVARG